jgi:Asp-tRNA(Asn)/Glu-tRNA(Gln) amidotransferase A subunit family amidase
MATTGGSWALVGCKAKKNAALVEKLVEAGLIIIAKGNLTVGNSLGLLYRMSNKSDRNSAV